MKIRSFGYCAKQGVRNIYRNRSFSLASVATMTACIFIFGLFYSILLNVSHMVDTVEDTVCVVVFFEPDASDEKIEEIGRIISARAEVASVHYTSAEEAWETYKEKYFENNPELADGFAQDNPLANSASYEIYLNDVSMQDALVSFLEGLDGIRQVNHSDITAAALEQFGRMVALISAIIILILFAVAIFLINNTVATGVTVRKEEIGIMKLIGATDAFVKAPFIVEGVIIGVIGALIPLCIIRYFYNRVVIYIATQFSLLQGVVTFLPVEQVFKTLLPVGVMLGLGVGLIGSLMSLRKHIRV